MLKPLVVATTAAHAAKQMAELAGWRQPRDPRRSPAHAAASAAGLAMLTSVVRDGLAGDDALAVMLSVIHEYRLVA